MKHDYGLNEQDEFKARLGWRYKPFKKVILTNAHLAKNRITVDKVEKQLENSFLFPEWRHKQAFWLVKSIVDASIKGEKRADITQMFSCDFFGDDHIGTVGIQQKDIQKQLMNKLFSLDFETKDVLAVKLKLKVIFL